ncbi:alpha-mannosidase [Fictibacillus fluitans]|uniref:Glycoside hydrolase family 38 C-terminal domain-containing protein n=1 Tax=Fictibacillus fluitans TaxID=3058422 RepID=A0ABT8HTH6_9BACL|nr:alpha-mannosidase [Fictibacillus sp. NE201]MDN4524082.1 glycoside hydrolase family 38 C-terminal domain-containing protein [Fictibacillus sp. NE201]
MKKLHMIGNAHLDPVWLWQWQEGFQETKATFRSALDRLNEYDDFIFTSSSAQFYEWIEENHPEMFKEIQERVKEGRWVLCGGWWIQPDCNIPGGESFVRQGLLGQRYFSEKFGVTAKVGYNVDSFGHHGMLPQILKKSGMDAYVFMRPGPDEKGLPGRLFVWESNDGSRVTAYRIPFEYCTFGNMSSHIELCKPELTYAKDEGMCFYGVGNHGGGPTKENIEEIRSLKQSDQETEIIFSDPNQYFEQIKGKEHLLPVVHDDLQHHASGCYSVHSEVKKKNRDAENRLLVAEKFSSIASVMTHQPYPADYNRAWKNILFNQFHDILAGTSIQSAYEDANEMYGEALSISSRGLNHALQAISWDIQIDEEEGMKPVVAFNPHAWEVTTAVEVEWGIFGNYGSIADVHVVDADGNEVPHQFIKPHAKVPGRKRIAFMAKLPALGYALYKIRPGSSETIPADVTGRPNTIESDRYHITFDKETGGLNIYDKEHELQVFEGPAALPAIIDDHSDTWGHGKLHFNQQGESAKLLHIKVMEKGPVVHVVRVTTRFNQSTITQDFTLHAQSPRIDVKVKVNWQEQHKTLKLLFPLNLNHRTNTYDIPFGTITREANGEEESMQQWLDVTGTSKSVKKRYGVSLINDGKYSADILGNVVGLTVLRSPIYAHHDPYEVQTDESYTYIDQGMQTFTYSILPHTGGWESAGTIRAAHEVNQKCPTVVETYHQGRLPATHSFLSVDAPNVIVTALKKSEDGEGIVLRLYEAHQTETVASIHLPESEREVEVSFKPCEIKTLYIPLDVTKPVLETDLTEYNGAPLRSHDELLLRN